MDILQALIDLAPEGLMLELGVGGGGTITNIANRTPRTVWGFDWFHGLPETWDEWDKAGAFTQHGEIPVVPDNVKIVSGLIQQSLPVFLSRHFERVAFVHFDLDLYSATSFALMAMNKRFAHGAILVFDEIVDRQRNLDNEGKAFCEFLTATNYCAEYLCYTRSVESLAFRLLTV